jgi:YesN/AraC family two-component response regulator
MNITYVFIYLVYGIVLINLVMQSDLIYPQIFSMSIIILYIGGIAFVHPEVFNKKYIFSSFKPKYEKSGLTNNFSKELKEQLVYLLYEDKIYKDPNLTLDLLSEKLQTTRHNVSQVINEHFNISFFNLINKFRVLEASDIFKNNFNHNLKIIEVAYKVGFSNKVTFNKAFKVETGKTPSQYLLDVRIGISA